MSSTDGNSSVEDEPILLVLKRPCHEQIDNILFCNPVYFFSVPHRLFPAEKDPFSRANEQKAYNENGDLLGTIKKEAGRFVFYDKDTVTFKKVSKDLWSIYNRDNQYVGKLLMAKTAFKLYNKNGKYIGVVIHVNERKAKARNNSPDIKFSDEFEYVSTVVTSLKINPEEAWLYNYVMEAIQ